MGKFCTNCGIPLQQNWNICPNCAIPIIKESSAQIYKSESPKSSKSETSLSDLYWFIGFIGAIVSRFAFLNPTTIQLGDIYMIGIYTDYNPFLQKISINWIEALPVLLISIASSTGVILCALKTIYLTLKLYQEKVELKNQLRSLGMLIIIINIGYMVGIEIYAFLNGSTWLGNAIGFGVVGHFISGTLIIVAHYLIKKKRGNK